MSRLTAITCLGHSAVMIEAQELRIGIDLFLEGNPLCPPDSRTPARLDLLILTHGHGDHAGDAVRIAKATGCKVLATYELAMLIGEEGIAGDRLIPMNKGGTVNFEGLRISLTNAFHSSSFTKSNGQTVYAGEPCGTVVSDGTEAVYHAGDTCLFSDMKLIHMLHHPTIAMIPIGDHFTMDPAAAALAAEYIAAPTVVPFHYGTFPVLTGTTGQFKELCPKNIKVVELRPGERYSIKS